jgi:hypothetical protein
MVVAPPRGRCADNASVTGLAHVLAVAALAATGLHPTAGAVHVRRLTAPRDGRDALVQVAPSRNAEAVLRRARAMLVSRALRIWKIRGGRAGRVVAELRQARVLETVEPDARLIPFHHLSAGDPLIPDEWWLHDIGADAAEPPGPGIPITVVDTGLDFSHPEFAHRPHTLALNRQSVFGEDEIHGTAVSSVAAAPANGIGLVGVYPDALLREWDFGLGRLSDALRGLDAASRHGRTVINFSAGFFRARSPLLEQAVDRVVQRGSVLVAAAGNEGERGSDPAVPAVLPHVLTIAATDELDRAATFSSRSRAVDMAAPGSDMPVAVPTYSEPSGYASFDGTSFSAPLVAGATAWVWTARPQLTNGQIVDVMRDSARDVGAHGWDRATGFGIVNIPSALAAPVPAIDPQEPNDDIFAVKPRGLTTAGHTPLTGPGSPSATVAATIQASEDPDDVYRLWLPPRGSVRVTTQGSGDVNVAVWGGRTTTIYERGRALRRDLLGFSERRGTRVDAVTVGNTSRRGRYVYADVFLGPGAGAASYTLTVSGRGRR